MDDVKVPEDAVTLIVAWSRREEARNLGASWSTEDRVWTIPRARFDAVPRDLLPIRDRPGLAPPYIRVNLVPQGSWGRNLRSMMTPEEWRTFKREHVYATTGSRCLVCGGRGPEWPVEADEVWRFDDATGIQTLAAVVPLCPACHEVRSAGLATAKGRGEAAARHLAWVERIPVTAARKRIADALATWERRSRRKWTIDLSLMERRLGLEMRHDARRTQAAHDALVADARARRGGRGPHSRGGRRS